MAYDVELADRLRELLATEPAVTEKRMFGGLAFLLGGRMAVAAGSSGALMLRIDPDDGPELLTDPRAHPFVMRGKELAGWLQVDVDEDVDDKELGSWIEHGVAYAKSLPGKT